MVYAARICPFNWLAPRVRALAGTHRRLLGRSLVLPARPDARKKSTIFQLRASSRARVWMARCGVVIRASERSRRAYARDFGELGVKLWYFGVNCGERWKICVNFLKIVKFLEICCFFCLNWMHLGWKIVCNVKMTNISCGVPHRFLLGPPDGHQRLRFVAPPHVPTHPRSRASPDWATRRAHPIISTPPFTPTSRGARYN